MSCAGQPVSLSNPSWNNSTVFPILLGGGKRVELSSGPSEIT
jgi:hypothetical protein